jgi:hypothetical protein
MGERKTETPFIGSASHKAFNLDGDLSHLCSGDSRKRGSIKVLIQRFDWTSGNSASRGRVKWKHSDHTGKQNCIHVFHREDSEDVR